MATFTTDGKFLFIDGIKVLRGWESFSGWYWFATEKVEVREAGENGGPLILELFKVSLDGRRVDDVIWFGFVQGIEEEWGDFSQAEIESLAPKTWEIPAKNLPHSGRRS